MHIAAEDDAPAARGHRPASERMKGVVDRLFARSRCLNLNRLRAAGFYVKSIGATTAGASGNVMLAIATGEGRDPDDRGS